MTPWPVTWLLKSWSTRGVSVGDPRAWIRRPRPWIRGGTRSIRASEGFVIGLSGSKFAHRRGKGQMMYLPGCSMLGRLPALDARQSVKVLLVSFGERM